MTPSTDLHSTRARLQAGQTTGSAEI